MKRNRIIARVLLGMIMGALLLSIYALGQFPLLLLVIGTTVVSLGAGMLLLWIGMNL